MTPFLLDKRSWHMDFDLGDQYTIPKFMLPRPIERCLMPDLGFGEEESSGVIEYPPTTFSTSAIIVKKKQSHKVKLLVRFGFW
jgi:hypothetical protein